MRPPLDKTVLITGASSGIGRELARQLAGRAATLVLVARREERLRELADEFSGSGTEVVVKPCDLCDREALSRLVTEVESELGGVDVLINNAGLGDVGLFDHISDDKLATMLDLNVTSLALLTRKLLPGMVARGRGGILNVSSGFGLTFMPVVAPYVGSKYFVSGFTQALRTELAGTGVVVSQLCPGPVGTEFEQVSGNPVGREVPKWIELTAEHCARDAIRGFERGRATIIPGWLMNVLVPLGQWTPDWMLRLMYRPLGGMLRKRLEEKGGEEAA